jgi:hypothetical protein
MKTERQYQTQKRGGTHKENFVKLQAEFNKIFTNSESISPRGLYQLMSQFLKSVEGLRMRSEKQIRDLQNELVFNQGTADACSTFSNLLVSMMVGYHDSGMLTGVKAKDVEEKEDKKESEEVKEDIVTDVEMLKKVCANCGCQDEGDMAECNCPCHDGKSCGNDQCIICKDLDNYELKKKKKKRKTRKKKE